MKKALVLSVLLSFSGLAADCDSLIKDSSPLLSSEVPAVQFAPIVNGLTNDDKLYWQALKQDNLCQQGRLQDKVFSLNSQQSAEVLSGYLTEGSSFQGDTKSLVFGRNVNGDLISIQQVKTDKGMAANVVVSLCKYGDHTADYISDDSNLTQFSLDRAHITDCNYGNCKRKTSLLSGSVSFNLDPKVMGNYRTSVFFMGDNY